MADRPRMVFLIDENAPASIGRFLEERGHTVHLVPNYLAAGSPDPLVAYVGDKLSAIVVSWDKDFEALVKRRPEGRQKFRSLGRISFKCEEPRGLRLLERWIDLIEYHYSQCMGRSDFRMIVTVMDSGCKFS